MDGWWNEEDTFYPFEEAPEEELSGESQEPSNPFKPISVSDRFEQMDTARMPPAPKAFTPPRPGQPYGQSFTRMPPLTPPKPFSQIQQGDLYGYNAPDDKPATVIPTNPYAVQPNPFGAGVGASPLGASTPDTLPTFTQRTGAVKRSDLHQTTSTGPVPIWSIDDDPVPASSMQGGANAPYPGFPPLPQTKPAPWQQPLMTAPLQDPNKDSLDWTLPAYPEANPDWKPSEEEEPVVPDFLKESQKEPEAEKAEETKSPMEKLNIPVYLRVQPLSRKPRPAPEQKQEAAQEKPSAAMPDSDKKSAAPAEPSAAVPVQEPAPQPEEYGDEIFMRPKDPSVEQNVPQTEPLRSTAQESLTEKADTAAVPGPETAACQPDGVQAAEQLSMLDLLGGINPDRLSDPVTPEDRAAESNAAEVSAPPASAICTDEPAQTAEKAPFAASMEKAAQVAEPPASAAGMDGPAQTAEKASFAVRTEETVQVADPPASAIRMDEPAQTAEKAPFVASMEKAAQIAEPPVSAAGMDGPAQTHDEPVSVPVTAVVESALSEPAPEDEIVSPAEQPPVEEIHPAPVAVTASNRRSRRSRMASREETSVQEPVASESPEAAGTTEQPPVEELAQRKRRSRRADHPQEADAAAAEDLRPFVPTVGAEDPAPDASAARPVESPRISQAADTVSPLSAFVRRNPDAAYAVTGDIDGDDDWRPFAKPFPADAPSFPEQPLFSATDSPFAHDLPPVPETSDGEWSPFGDSGSADLPVFPEDTPAKAKDSPFAHDLPPIPDVSEQSWSLFGDSGSADASLFTPNPKDSPFAHDLPPIPDTPEGEWPLFGASDSQEGSGSLYGDRFPTTAGVSTGTGDLFADSPPSRSTAEKASPTNGLDGFFPLFGEDEQEHPWMASAESPSPDDEGELFKDSASNLTAEESPLYGTSSFDAGDMPNPTRGNLPYELVSGFDTKSRQKVQLAEEQPLFEPESQASEKADFATGSWTASSPTVQQQAAKPLLTQKAAQPKPKRPPINPVRLILLLLAVAMAVFCIVAGCKMLMGYVQNTEDWARSHEEFLNQHGISMNQAGEMVQLPQDGSTFAPSNGSVPMAAHGFAGVQQAAEATQPTPVPLQRTKLYQYPDNPLRNQIASITDIREEYPEVVGRIVIPGVIDEWIMHRNNTYYLNHNFRGTSAEGGAVFMDAACMLDTPPENLHLRGSGSVPGKTFHALWQYKTGGTNFVYEAEVAHVTTLYEETKYLLYAVIEASGDPASPAYFNYASHPTFATDEEMLNYMALAQQHSLYTLPTDVQPGDRLLTLSTVTGADDGGDGSTNLVLIFRSMR